ncbi:MAG: TIGR00645 family protein [Burkholderiaceae bacterium]
MAKKDFTPSRPVPRLRPLPALIFASRWLQLPLYLGLIVAQVVYVVLFFEELVHLVTLLWSPDALHHAAERLHIAADNKETVVMIIVLSLIDVVMISNLLIMVIVGGYETFVSRLNLDDHPDQPEWLSHVNANVLKVKLGTAIIGISSIHLLKTFISTNTVSDKSLLWQTIIHCVFLLSALAIALIDRVMVHHSDLENHEAGPSAAPDPTHAVRPPAEPPDH